MTFTRPKSVFRSTSQFTNQGPPFRSSAGKNASGSGWKGGSVYSRHQAPSKAFKSSSQNSSGLSNQIFSNQFQNAARYNFQQLFKSQNNSGAKAGDGQQANSASKLQDECGASNSSGGENSAFKSRFNNFSIQNQTQDLN